MATAPFEMRRAPGVAAVVGRGAWFDYDRDGRLWMCSSRKLRAIFFNDKCRCDLSGQPPCAHDRL